MVLILPLPKCKKKDKKKKEKKAAYKNRCTCAEQQKKLYTRKYYATEESIKSTYYKLFTATMAEFAKGKIPQTQGTREKDSERGAVNNLLESLK